MFNFFNSKKYEPLDLNARKYFEQNFLWLMQQFPEPELSKRRLLLPTKEDFPIEWNKSEENALEALEIICANMQINPKDIDFSYYNNAPHEIDMGGSPIFIESGPAAAGQFQLEKVNGKYQISLDRALLENPEALIATIAHELAHVKLLGEKQLEENDELLTDFTTVFFGLGIFNANNAYNFYQKHDSWGYSSAGYLRIEEWAYALALFAFARYDDNPDWKKYLSKMITNDFEKCLKFMRDNEKDIFKIEEEQK
jgi:hypothetical protein